MLCMGFPLSGDAPVISPQARRPPPAHHMCMLLLSWHCDLLCRAVFGSGGLKALQGAILMWNTIVSGNEAAEGAGIQVCFWRSSLLPEALLEKAVKLGIASWCAAACSTHPDHKGCPVTASA